MVIMIINTNLAEFYCKSANLIGSPILFIYIFIFYSLIEQDRDPVALKRKIILDLWIKKIHQIVVLYCNLLDYLLKQLDCSSSFSMSDSLVRSY